MRRSTHLFLAIVLWLPLGLETKAEPISFANFGVYIGNATEPGGKAIHLDGPYPWTSDPALADKQLETLPPLPGWDPNVVWDYQFEMPGPFVTGPEGVLSGPFFSHSTITAHADDGSVLGTLVLEGQGSIAVDLRPDNAVVDETSGLILRKYWNTVTGFDEPAETYTLVEGTGIYENLRPVGPWVSYGAGNSLLWRNPNISLEENLDQAFIFGASSPFVTTGVYEMVPEPSSLALLILAAGVWCISRSPCLLSDGQQ